MVIGIEWSGSNPSITCLFKVFLSNLSISCSNLYSSALTKEIAISLVSADEYKLLQDIERLLKKTLKRQVIDGFEPDHSIPITTHEAVRKKVNNQRGFKKRFKSKRRR